MALEQREAGVAGVNWAGNHTYTAERLHRPSTLDEVREIVAGAPRIRVLGSRHSFNAIADAPELISLDALPPDVEVAPDRATVACAGAVRYGELARVLADEGLALGNLASLPHISVAGAVATATHGSGNGNRNLAAAVAAVELVTSDGEVRRFARGDDDFAGVVVGLGALGAVTRVTLDVEPAYEVTQRVYEALPWDALFEGYDAITASGYSVSVFSRWAEAVDQVWVKRRTADDDGGDPEPLAAATPATVERHPILGIDPVNCTAQRGVPGPWSDRLPHFRMGFTPSNGQEIQSEYLLPREHAVAAFRALRALGGTLGPILQVCELRTVAADDLWLSPQYERDTIGVHFTWVRDPAAVERALADVEAALLPLDARPHWGKVFLAGAAEIAPRYPRMGDFADLVARLDPRGAFRNRWLATHVLPE